MDKVIYILLFMSTIILTAGMLVLMGTYLASHYPIINKVLVKVFNSLQFRDEDKISSISNIMDEGNK